MREACRRCSAVTIGLSIGLFVLAVLLLVMGPIMVRMTSYSTYIADYEPTTCVIAGKSVTATGCSDGAYVATFTSTDKSFFVSAPTSAKLRQSDATARLGDYNVETLYDCYCQRPSGMPSMVIDPLTCNVWPNCFLDVASVLEFKKVYQVHQAGQITWILALVAILLVGISLIVGCGVKGCTKRTGYEELQNMQAKLDKPV